MDEKTMEPTDEMKSLIMAQDATDEPDATEPEGGEADGDR